MSALKILKAAREKITPVRAWTRGSYARDKNGCSIAPTHSTAICWCSVGALMWAAETNPGHGHGVAVHDALMALNLVIEDCDLVHFNDHPVRKHAEVLAKFDEAIASLEGVAA